MKANNLLLKKDEQAVFSLRSLYENYGYSQYKMNKFEAYDLYAKNKDFLVSDKVITFNDADGKLMALKPDVTLSIIKNGVDGKEPIQKVYYDENVYRVPKGASSFKEIMQVGLECIGEVDDYCVYEVLLLAIKSLALISEDFVLDVSHVGVVAELLNSLSVSESDKKKIINCIGEKNVHDLKTVCDDQRLIKLASTYGSLESVLPVLTEVYNGELSNSAKLLVLVVKALEDAGYKNKVRIDFSVLDDMNYYSGIVFKGFVDQIPQSILSGGQYDHLMKRLKRNSKAIGFAVYLDMLQQFIGADCEYDVDTLIVYERGTPIGTVTKITDELISQGKSVLARASLPQQLKYRALINLKKDGGER